jgi:hypothetical protein
MKYRTTLLLDSQDQMIVLAKLFNAVNIFGKRAPSKSVSAGLCALAKACLAWTPQEFETFKDLLTPPDDSAS